MANPYVPSGNASSGAPAPVELWYSRCGAATASVIAIRKQWLQAEFSGGGTVLRSLKDSSEREILDAHYHHRLSGLFREGGNIPPIWARSKGEDTAVVAITWLDEYQSVLTRRDSGIERIADLRGKRLGLPRHDNLIDFQRGAALHGFVTALALEGLGPDDVVFVDLPVPKAAQFRRQGGERPRVEVDALLAGTVDAIFLRFAQGVRWSRDPRLKQLVNLNDLPDPLLRVNNGTPRPVTVDRAFLDRHPDLVARYLAVLIKTARWAEANPSELLSLLVQEGGAADVEEVLASHGHEVHRSFHPRLSEQYVRGLAVQKNFLRDHGFLVNDFDVEAWIEPAPLAAALALVEEEAASSRNQPASAERAASAF
jgi:sulfonate transport system substrate-binding protein